MLKISYAGCLGLSPAISSQFGVEMCAASKNFEKFTKTTFWGVQGGSRSLMLINPKSLSPVLVMIAACMYLSATVFTLFEPITPKWRLFRGYPSLTPSFEGNPCTQWHEILSRYTRDLGAANSKNFVILACAVLIQITSVTDRQTDRRPDDDKDERSILLSRVIKLCIFLRNSVNDFQHFCNNYDKFQFFEYAPNRLLGIA